MKSPIPFTEIGRLPHPNDNCAIAITTLEPDTAVSLNTQTITLQNTVLEGHRFAVRDIPAGEELLSWSLPFGIATHDIAAGDYVCNTAVLDELNMRTIDITLPAQANFTDLIRPTALDRDTFVPADPLPRLANPGHFMGYRRPGTRGVGTRNTIILLGTTARTAAFVRQLQNQLQPRLADYPNVDNIVAVAHTEGDTPNPNNRDLLLRTLAGWIVHPNVAAALIVDHGSEPINNQTVAAFMQTNNYPLADVPHHFLSIQQGFVSAQQQAEQIVADWLPKVNKLQRQQEPLSELKIALQCGGSDAFSGISGNPLIGWVARELIQHGGAANLAETDELMGAEPYILHKVSSLETAVKFLHTIDRFKQWAGRHGVTPEANPSGGNRLRGLYNIALKSIGAANKKDPAVPLDFVLDYSEPMTASGYYFMDSPGNDLESLAGQVASGCNLIFFVTGNGSITNFPFVPTLKVVTTSRRFALLANDMDINAGRFLDGLSLDALGRETFDLMVASASGQQTVGEKAGHVQAQIWRNWAVPEGGLAVLEDGELRGERPYPLPLTNAPTIIFPIPAPHIGLILPTSLCAGQIAQMAAQRLNQTDLPQALGISRFETVVHTEGCGVSRGSLSLYTQTLLGHLAHPLVKHALLLEHGCEKTHNDYFRQAMRDNGRSPEEFGWASIQLDGGIQAVLAKMAGWFSQRRGAEAQRGWGDEEQGRTSARSLTIGLLAAGGVSEQAAAGMMYLMQAVVANGGSVIVPERFGLAMESVLDEQRPSLSYGRMPQTPGLHIMATPNCNWSEVIVGLGAAGANIIVANIGDHPRQGHPFIPVLQVSDDPQVVQTYAADLDGDTAVFAQPQNLTQLIQATLAGEITPKCSQSQNVYFQISRGSLGIST